MSLASPILIIDDEPQIRKLLRISLASQGHALLEAQNAERGLAQIALHQPALVVLDLGLPDRDGLQVLADLREWSQVPVIIFSTPKESAVLSKLAQQPGRVLIQRQLPVDIWGASHQGDTHYLRVVVGHLRRKLGDDPCQPRYLHTEAGAGYRLQWSPPGNTKK